MAGFYQLLATTLAMILCIIPLNIGHALVGSHGETKILCVESESEALLKFRRGLEDTLDRFSSWAPGTDCCKWKGVKCNGSTGHVVSLDLGLPCDLCFFNIMQGEINSGLLGLPYLTYLDLSCNYFNPNQLPAFLGSLNNLQHLNLSHCNLEGTIPDDLRNLSRLKSLDLSRNGKLRVNNLEWLYSFSSLKVLDLTRVNLSNTADGWMHAVNVLPSLAELRLHYCQLDYVPPSLPQVNCDSLLTLDLSDNQFNTSALLDWVSQCCHNLRHLNLSCNYDLRVSNLEWLNNLSSLKVLDLSGVDLSNTADGWMHAVNVIPSLAELRLPYCQLDYVPPSLPQVNCDSLLTLDLSYNNFNTSAILDWVFQSCHNLRHLDLSHNELNGTFKTSLMQQLSKLVVLDVSQSDLEGVISDVDLENFDSLQVLDLSENHFIFNMTRDWIPPFQLETISLGHCHLGPQFPKWIQTQKNFSYIDISYANISDVVPDWFWHLSPIVEYIDLSYNDLRGHVPDLSSKMKLQTLDLRNNNFTCPLPNLPQSIREINLARNSFFGPIVNICNINLASLIFLHLSSNKFSENLPDCWTNGTNLFVLRLADNHFDGLIPDTFGAFTNLLVLSLNKNDFSGNLPLSIKNCTSLVVFDVGNNKLSGTIPSGIGDIEGLYALILSSNAFEGNIPSTLCNIKPLRILDFSFNQLSGAIPRCIFAAMATEFSNYGYTSAIGYSNTLMIEIDYTERLLLTWKGRNLTTFATEEAWELLKVLDLSSNFLTGDIPEQITGYVGLKSLNLSRNQLEGAIPTNIGNMESLEVLDLSWNKLTGIIPTSMIDMDQLGVLDISHNNLTGQIPLGRHLDTFDASSFMDNPNLCGRQLNKSCSTITDGSFQDPNDPKKGGRRGSFRISSFYISMGIGFVTGFWAIWGPLLVSRSWNQAYFRFLGRMYDKIYVMVAITMAKLRRKLQG